MNDRVDAGNVEGGLELRVHGGIVTNGSGNHRQRRADQRSRRKAAALPCALIIHKEETGLRFLADGPTEAAAEDVLFHRRTRLCSTIQEILVCIQRVVAEELVNISVERPRTRLQDGVDIAPAVATLRSVVERGLHFKFLNHIRVRQRDVGGLRDVVVGSADALDQVVVIVLALAVHDHANVAAPELSRSIQLALRA